MFKLLLALSLSLHVFANTEIVNFRASEYHNDGISFTNYWAKLNYTHSEYEWALLPAPLGTSMLDVCSSKDSTVRSDPCPHELWLVLDLARAWTAYSSFTLRLSWPASYPADFSLQIFNHKSLSTHFGLPLGPSTTSQATHTPSSAPQTRLQYARIRLVDMGVLTPYPSHAASAKPTPIPVPFILVIEPLYFGVLPPSVVPVLGYIVLVCLSAWMFVPTIIRYLNKLAEEARKELSVKVKQQ
ncbi:hypothetical protein DXG01_002131 [Tephrocybe rancida]|nr:hypothetical protein DXG01_002131 [Tephrocybe rancida]